MTSLLTNASAMTALQTLTQTSKNLEMTQNRIATGLRVSTASDNAAYWSIATTMKSDNKALSTVQDALGLGAATVDVAYTALDSTKDVLDAIKTKLVAATQPGVDKSKIQSEVSQLQKQLTSIASTASFSGSNWLSVDSDSANYVQNQQIVASFSRDNNGALNIGTISVDTSGIALFDAGAGGAGKQTGVGLLDQGNTISSDGTILNGGQKDATATSTSAKAAVTMNVFGSTALTLDDDDVISFDVAVDGGAAKTVTINKAVVSAALSSTDGKIATAANMATVITKALQNAGFDGTTDVVAGVTAGAVTLTSQKTGATGDASSVTVSNTASSSNGNLFAANSFDISTASVADINKYIAGIDAMAGKVTSAASDLGAIKSRISLQTDFVKNLMDAVDRGVGQLVDADMNEESTKLQALQVQQQLGIQALSIANTNSQNILALFK